MNRRSMNRRSVVRLLASAALLPAALPALAQDFRPYEAAAFAQLMAERTTTVVHVHATWCPTCRAQRPALQALADDPAFARVRFVNVDYDTDRAFQSEHRIPGRSTVVVFRGGREVERFTGVTDGAEIRERVRRAALG